MSGYDWHDDKRPVIVQIASAFWKLPRGIKVILAICVLGLVLEWTHVVEPYECSGPQACGGGY